MLAPTSTHPAPEARPDTPESQIQPSTRTARLIGTLDRRPGRVFAAVAVVTALLVIPFLAMAPTESASTEPGGSAFDARDRVDERFVSTVRPILFIAEHDGGNVLTADALRELDAAQDAVRTSDVVGSALFEFFDTETANDVDGVFSLVDLVERELAENGVGLDDATDAQVADAGTAVIDRYGERSDAVGISAQSARTADGSWVVPAVNVTVVTDDSVLGFGNTSVTFGGGTDVEEFDRRVQEIVRSATPTFEVHGVAIDVNLTAEEQGAVAGPFIGFTILAVLLIVGLTFRSYWITAIVGSLLVVLIIWLKGISNLIGLEDDLVLSLIVPIAMVSFGVDFAFHSIGRYREERADGSTARPAFVRGLHAVSGALVLALASDSVAFLSNVSAGIESIVQFGVGAAIALAAAFVLLGVVAPLAVAHVEHSVPAPNASRRGAAVRVGAAVAAASLAMTSVLLLVFILPWLGVVVTVLTIASTLVVPYLLARRRGGRRAGQQTTATGSDRFASTIAVVVTAVAARRAIVLPTLLVLTIGAGFLAARVPAEFDVEDYFASDTDFVVSLDQLDTHVGDRGGEPGTVYVEGELTDPSALRALGDAVEAIRELDTQLLARNADGRVDVDTGVFEVFDATWASPVMVGLVAQQTGVAVSDDDADGIPDTAEQVEALITVASRTGVPIDAERLSLTPDEVRVRIDLAGTPATRLDVSLTDTRSQQSVGDVQDALAPIVTQLSNDLGGSFVETTGGPIVRAESLEATNRALNLSLPIAVVLCLLVAAVFLRSFRYGLASIVPILMVVAWLYAFMELAGYAINLVTATIAAVSIGIGIDFAIHFIVRYREELARHGDRETAVEITAGGTGTALVASAFSSAVGFGILALAPMPLFAAYGLLTAIMIALALAATLLVLPGVLVAVTSDRIDRAPGS